MEGRTTSLKDQYKIMAETMRGNPDVSKIDQYLLEEIFGVYGSRIEFRDGRFCFTHNDEIVADFAVLVLGVEKVSNLYAPVMHFVEMLIISPDTAPKIIKVDSLKLGSNRWIEQQGVHYTFVKKAVEARCNAIKIMCKYAPETTVYHFSGWVADKNDTYILNGRELCSKVTKPILEKEHCTFALEMLEIADWSLTVPLLSAMLLSLVHSKMMEMGEFFRSTLILAGQSQSFKTTTAALFFDISGGSKSDINFDCTEAAILRNMANKRDCVTLIDDLKPPSTRQMKNRLVTMLEKIIRFNSDNSNGYQKAGAKNTTTTVKPGGITVVTAEDVPVDVYSSMARILVLEMNRNTIDKAKLTNIQGNHKKYRSFIENYILYVSELGVDLYCDNLYDRFLKERSKFRTLLNEKGITLENRTNDACVFLSIAVDEFLAYARLCGALDDKQIIDYKKRGSEVYLNMVEEQSVRINEQSEINLFFYGLAQLLNTKEARLRKVTVTGDNVAEETKTAIGFIKDGYVYLKNGVAFKQVVDHYKKYGKDFAISEAALRKQIYDNGYLVSKSSKLLVTSLTVNKEKYQCIKFKESIFNNLTRGDKDERDENEAHKRRLEAEKHYLGGGN